MFSKVLYISIFYLYAYLCACTYVGKGELTKCIWFSDLMLACSRLCLPPPWRHNIFSKLYTSQNNAFHMSICTSVCEHLHRCMASDLWDN